MFAGGERHVTAVGAPGRCRRSRSPRLLRIATSATSHWSTVTVACKAHYKTLHDACAAVLEQSFDGIRAESMALSHSFIVDLDQWLVELTGRSESVVIKAAVLEYQLALLALCRGHYRAAFGSLRLALELALAAIRWSTNERELREWKRGSRDSVWAVLIDKENGVFSRQFIMLFTEPLSDEAGTYRAAAETVYRECSEYVHGNAHTHDDIPATVAFAEAPFGAWHQKASTVRLSISFALAARYLSDLDAGARARLEPMLLAHLGHSAAVRAILGAPVETSDD